ncbi:MAG: hypothetical protein KGJ23_08530 [Euryarchaeota archaeon]|nr:hypothetical protein [Euryarchaeota archaeon]MDE1836648.1 hypothetical protein [Euryarchaeota archaeon]MDE1880323.1 hypothetical protein [Euryarchaeota archaeon]MDE2044618.1 hypothetical protein [Thermoplasmata archaeon]
MAEEGEKNEGDTCKPYCEEFHRNLQAAVAAYRKERGLEPVDLAGPMLAAIAHTWKDSTGVTHVVTTSQAWPHTKATKAALEEQLILAVATDLPRAGLEYVVATLQRRLQLEDRMHG